MNIGINQILMNDSEELDISKCQPISNEEIQALAKRNKNTAMYTLEVTIKLVDEEQNIEKEFIDSIEHKNLYALEAIFKKTIELMFYEALKL